MKPLNFYDVPQDVKSHIDKYITESLPAYKVMYVQRYSNHPEDNHLYMVVGYNKMQDTFAVWTTWNESTQSLNNGSYGIATLQKCLNLLKELQVDIRVQRIESWRERNDLTDSQMLDIADYLNDILFEELMDYDERSSSVCLDHVNLIYKTYD